ncbi:family 31 glycoside hydrolase [Ochromonadaceae sp. CCMP2298]|nr:family 31 glycoside hydrolase [Ochromonadaceae sp. CCMP2298]
MDIDYMSRYWDFTLDEARFPLQQTQTFIDTLHKNGQRFVPIVDPGIYVKDQSYSAYTEGVKMDVFVKDMHGDAYLSQVWPGPTNFPDWYAPNTQAYWSQQISQFHSLLAFDGLWIDMNEASNFCNLDGRACAS